MNHFLQSLGALLLVVGVVGLTAVLGATVQAIFEIREIVETLKNKGEGK